jgi:putative SOS response-associated peptidase YedK
MCGRYASYLPPDFIARLFGTLNPLPSLQPTWNLAPTDDAPVIRRDPASGERHLDILKWGLVPFFTKGAKAARKPINARSETVATAGMFKVASALTKIDPALLIRIDPLTCFLPTVSR